MADPPPSRTRRLLGGAGVVAFLTVVWVVLWGTPTWLNVVGGVGIGTVLLLLSPQPRSPFGVGGRPLRLLATLGIVVVDILRSTVRVAWAAVRTGPRTRSALVEVSTPACRPEVLVLASSLISISPGTMVVEIDEERYRLLVHVLPVDDLEQARADMQQTAGRLVRALRGEAGAS